MSKLIFAADDFRDNFNNTSLFSNEEIHEIMDLAQATFDKWLEDQKIVYRQPGFGGHSWQENLHDANNRTHQARLCCVEEIPKKPCEHDGFIRPDGSVQYTWPPICHKCGAHLKATWTEVE